MMSLPLQLANAYRGGTMSKTSQPISSPDGALAGLALCALMPSLGTSIANVALPTFADVLDAPFRQVQWIVIAYLVANTALIAFAGRLGDLLGRRRLLVAGLIVFTLASLLCGMAPTLGWLVAARALQGAGAAVLMALAMALVGETIPKQQTGRAMGLLGTTSAVGTALGPTLGGLLISSFGWPAIFFVNLPLGLLALHLAMRHLPPDPTAPEAASRKPGFLTALREPTLAASLAMTGLVSTVMMATLVVGPFYLARALGLATTGVGLVMSAGPVVSAFTGVPAGRLVDRFGAQRMAIFGLVGMGGGCVALALSPTAWGVAGYLLPLVAVTANYALFQAANNTAVMQDVAADRRGLVSGVLNLARNLGLIAGASAMGAVFAFASGAHDLASAHGEAVAAGMRATFGTAAVLITVALAIALRRGKAHFDGAAA